VRRPEQIGAFKYIPNQPQGGLTEHDCGQPGTSGPFERRLDPGFVEQMGTAPRRDTIPTNPNAGLIETGRTRHNPDLQSVCGLLSSNLRSNDENHVFFILTRRSLTTPYRIPSSHAN
jgi:hypothetical protein